MSEGVGERKCSCGQVQYRATLNNCTCGFLLTPGAKCTLCKMQNATNNIESCKSSFVYSVSTCTLHSAKYWQHVWFSIRAPAFSALTDLAWSPMRWSMCKLWRCPQQGLTGCPYWWYWVLHSVLFWKKHKLLQSVDPVSPMSTFRLHHETALNPVNPHLGPKEPLTILWEPVKTLTFSIWTSVKDVTAIR